MATIKDVAKRAGVSTTTVSHVINKTRFVAEETKSWASSPAARIPSRSVTSKSLRAMDIDTTKRARTSSAGKRSAIDASRASVASLMGR